MGDYGESYKRQDERRARNWEALEKMKPDAGELRGLIEQLRRWRLWWRLSREDRMTAGVLPGMGRRRSDPPA